MQRTFLGLGLSLMLALAGCSTTPSKPLTMNNAGQFSSYNLNNHTFRVSFRGAANMSYGVAEEITLVKAAQTTLLNGFRYFKVLNDPSNRSQPQQQRQTVVYPMPSYSPYGYWGHRYYPGFGYDPYFDAPQVVHVDPVEVSYTIECYTASSKAPADAFDASMILQAIGAKYGLAGNGQPLVYPAPAPTSPKPTP